MSFGKLADYVLYHTWVLNYYDRRVWELLIEVRDKKVNVCLTVGS